MMPTSRRTLEGLHLAQGRNKTSGNRLHECKCKRPLGVTSVLRSTLVKSGYKFQAPQHTTSQTDYFSEMG